MATQEEIDSFYRFVSERLVNGGSEMSIDELYDQWRLENTGPEHFTENVAAIQASIDDMNRGDTGRNAAEVIRDLRGELDLPTAE